MGKPSISSVWKVSAQCELPQPYSGNTGTNMTVFFTTSALDLLSTTSDSPYIVAISPSGLVVGSASISSSDLIGGQQSVAVWGDDTATPDLDGALSGDVLTFQLVDGNSLYDLDLGFAGVNSFVSNGTVPVISAITTLNCVDASIVSNCDHWFSHTQISSSVADMSVFLGSEFTSSLGIEIPNLSPDDFVLPGNTGANMTVAVNVSSLSQYAGGQIGAFYDLDGDGNLECVGLDDIDESGFIGLALWGDDSFTDEIDGLPTGQFRICYLVLWSNYIY